jgi:hypothetical protein
MYATSIYFLLIQFQPYLTWFHLEVIAPSYIMFKIRLANKRYGKKNLIVSMGNLVEC